MPRVLALVLILTGCLTARVETATAPTTVHLRVCAEDVDVDMPSMRGGYDERGGKKSRVSDPYQYRVIQVRDGDGVVTELSLHDVDGLPKDEAGRAVVPVQCAAGPATVVGPSR